MRMPRSLDATALSHDVSRRRRGKLPGIDCPRPLAVHPHPSLDGFNSNNISVRNPTRSIKRRVVRMEHAHWLRARAHVRWCSPSNQIAHNVLSYSLPRRARKAFIPPLTRCQTRKSVQNGSTTTKSGKQGKLKEASLDNRLVDIVRYRYFEEL